MDPRVAAPGQRSANLSPLMEAKGKTQLGDKANFCPFGCADHELDDNGYCRHVVGFTNDKQAFEPLMPPDARGRRVVDGSNPQPVLRGDKLVQITTSWRVYRDVDEAELEAATRPH